MRATFRGVTIAAMAAIATLGAAPQPRDFPPRLSAFFAGSAHLSQAERGRLLAGESVARLLDGDPSHEVAVFGAVWINAAPERYVGAVRDIERFESGPNFPVTRKISSPPRLEDFDALTLPADDIEDLRQCKVSDCAVKISREGLERLRQEVDWSKPTAAADVNALMRRIAFEYVQAYSEGGNERLAVYRDQEHPTFVAQEFRSMVDRMPGLTDQLPKVRRYLLEYPHYTLPAASDILYWQITKFGLKPTVRINHLMILEDGPATVVANKQLYASHYFWTAIELRVLIADPARGPGFWFVNVNRSRSDGLSGFVGSLIRGKVRGEALDGLTAVLKGTKERLEGAPAAGTTAGRSPAAGAPPR